VERRARQLLVHPRRREVHVAGDVVTRTDEELGQQVLGAASLMRGDELRETVAALHRFGEIALVPESVSRSMYTSSERSRNVLYPASASARSRSARESMVIGSTTLIFQGSAQLLCRMPQGSAPDSG
jgi:hypothetical protein